MFQCLAAAAGFVKGVLEGKRNNELEGFHVIAPKPVVGRERQTERWIRSSVFLCYLRARMRLSSVMKTLWLCHKILLGNDRLLIPKYSCNDDSD